MHEIDKVQIVSKETNRKTLSELLGITRAMSEQMHQVSVVAAVEALGAGRVLSALHVLNDILTTLIEIAKF